MLCHSCGKQRGTVGPKKSALIPNVTLMLCETCREKRYEPRHLIVVVGRSYGAAKVREYILKRLYVGEEITAVELTT